MISTTHLLLKLISAPTEIQAEIMSIVKQRECFPKLTTQPETERSPRKGLRKKMVNYHNLTRKEIHYQGDHRNKSLKNKTASFHIITKEHNNQYQIITSTITTKITFEIPISKSTTRFIPTQMHSRV